MTTLQCALSPRPLARRLHTRKKERKDHAAPRLRESIHSLSRHVTSVSKPRHHVSGLCGCCLTTSLATNVASFTADSLVSRAVVVSTSSSRNQCKVVARFSIGVEDVMRGERVSLSSEDRSVTYACPLQQLSANNPHVTTPTCKIKHFYYALPAHVD